MFECSEEFSGDVALEAAADFSVGFALFAAAFDVGAGAFVAERACEDYDVDCPVELAVALTVEAVSDGLA